MRMSINVFTCHGDQEGQAVGTAHVRRSVAGRRILRIDMEALPVGGGLCLSLEDVLILADEQQPAAEVPAAPLLH